MSEKAAREVLHKLERAGEVERKEIKRGAFRWRRKGVLVA